jgi:hypothetical protein
MLIIINHHKIVYNTLWQEWQVSYYPDNKNNDMFGYPCGSFKALPDAIHEANNG